jgi:glycosyltransferase involved in cell wall biosynthesis
LKILVIIPAYNEEESIAAVISQVRHHRPDSGIVVINDGSTDFTAQRASEAGAAVIDLPFNLGIGGAMQTGYLYAFKNKYEIAIQVDGDGQHDPSYINKLLEPIFQGKADMVIGSRYIQETAYRSSFCRRSGMIFFSALVNLLTGKKIKDTTSGFRAVNKKVIKYFSEHYPTDYPEVDVLVKLHRKKFKVVELPVEMYTRKGGRSSITPVRSLYYLLKVSLSILIESLRSAIPEEEPVLPVEQQ